MENTPNRKVIAVSQLLVDLQNPRLPDIQESQHDAIKSMTKSQAEKIVALAQHLVEHGTNPANLPIVMPSEDEEGKYYVLDGNRRVTTLKLLEAPGMAEGIFNGADLQRLKQLSAKFQQNPISLLDCIVVPDRDAADTWIQLIHRGQNQGAGLVAWDGQVAARYDERKGDKPEIALQILDYMKVHASLSDETRERINDGKFPITNLERLINTPYVRKKLGLEVEDGNLLVVFPEEEVLKGLNRIVEDIGTGRITVSKIKNQQQRIDYINNLDSNELPEASTILAKPHPLGSPPPTNRNGTKEESSRKANVKIRNRATLIPQDCKLGINHTRVNKLYRELKTLNLEEYSNAGAVLLRVFVELSLDHFLEHTIAWPEQQIQNSKLAQKLTTVANYFESNNILTQQQLAPIKKAMGGQTLLAASVNTMHAYIHNRHFSPVASELKTAWDDLQPFIGKIWPI